MRDGSRVSDYEYELPPGRIARYPTERRDRSRLLVVPWGGEPFEHRIFSDLVDLLKPGDVLVVNESRVSPARLLGRKPTLLFLPSHPWQPTMVAHVPST